MSLCSAKEDGFFRLPGDWTLDLFMYLLLDMIDENMLKDMKYHPRSGFILDCQLLEICI